MFRESLHPNMEEAFEIGPAVKCHIEKNVHLSPIEACSDGIPNMANLRLNRIDYFLA
jgi:hypothetical protein